MKQNRRRFLISTALAASSFGVVLPAQITGEQPRKRVKLGISTYSYWHFRDPKVSIETVIDKAGVIGVGGVDILHRQMDLPEKAPLDAAGRAYLRKLKRHAFLNGIDLICVSTHQNFVNPKPEVVFGIHVASAIRDRGEVVECRHAAGRVMAREPPFLRPASKRSGR